MKVDNEELAGEIAESRNIGRITDRLGAMIMELAETLGNHPSYRNYSMIEDMKGEAIMRLVANITKFDPGKSSNAFSYATKIVENCFRQVIEAEKRKHWGLEDRLAEEGDLYPRHIDPSEFDFVEPVEEPEPVMAVRGFANFKELEKESFRLAEERGLSEPNRKALLRDMREEWSAAKKEERRLKKERNVDSKLLMAMELMDSQGFDWEKARDEAGVDNSNLKRAVRGKSRPHLRRSRCEALGIDEEDYPDFSSAKP